MQMLCFLSVAFHADEDRMTLESWYTPFVPLHSQRTVQRLPGPYHHSVGPKTGLLLRNSDSVTKIGACSKQWGFLVIVT